MLNRETILKQVRSAFEREALVNVHNYPISLTFSGDDLVLEGETESIAAKKLALELAGSTEGVTSLVDRLRVAPAEPKGDGAMRDALCKLLLQESEFQNCTMRLWIKGQEEILREPSGDLSGEMAVAVEDGVITFTGKVISLSHKRLAGALGWWVPGCRDVVNELEVSPPEDDNDDEVTDALCLVLEADPMLEADQIHVTTSDHVVTLDGFVPNEQERKRAELDAWAVFAVNRVINHLEVQRA